MRKRDDLIDFITPTDPGLSIIDGRNGMFHIKELHVWESHDHIHVYLDGIGKRGLAIRGGLRVTKNCFYKTCFTFLKEWSRAAGHDKYRDAAKKLHHREGELEIDDVGIVSKGED